MRALLAISTLAFVVVSGVPASAQQTAADPEALAQAKILMEKVGTAALARQAYDAQLEAVMRILKSSNPGKADEVEKVMPLFRTEFEKRMPQFLDAVAAIYALHFDATELAAINSFYESAVGKKLVAELPSIIGRARVLGSVFGKKLSEDVVRTLRPELEKRSLKLEPFKT